MLEILPDLSLPEDELRWTFSRSGGPGGQNVNKTASRVTIHLAIRESDHFTDDQKSRIQERLANRINNNGELVIHADDTRDQSRNRELARERLIELLRRALRVERPRRPTRPTRGSVERRLDGKNRRSSTKRGRQPPRTDE